MNTIIFVEIVDMIGELLSIKKCTGLNIVYKL
jgi:hypothetical protein